MLQGGPYSTSHFAYYTEKGLIEATCDLTIFTNVACGFYNRGSATHNKEQIVKDGKDFERSEVVLFSLETDSSNKTVKISSIPRWS